MTEPEDHMDITSNYKNRFCSKTNLHHWRVLGHSNDLFSYLIFISVNNIISIPESRELHTFYPDKSSIKLKRSITSPILWEEGKNNINKILTHWLLCRRDQPWRALALVPLLTSLPSIKIAMIYIQVLQEEKIFQMIARSEWLAQCTKILSLNRARN